MTITYEVKDALYINLTNRCTNSCTFCVRNIDGWAESTAGTELWLTQEPSAEEVIRDLLNRDLSRYRELVFCGFGEPMVRTAEIIEICQRLKQEVSLPIRINTNGQANLVCDRDITPLLHGLVDAVSISLNAKDRTSYQTLCRSQYGEQAYDALLDFAVCCQRYVPTVTLTVVDCLPAEDIEVCRATAERIGVKFRVRPLL
ncbi:MAG: TatD family nuclease-associated radical SAM protein [Peptococcaceae bacterium]|nr:TatD family nuclease-associated radical SAM protein [Peptococcaceae bacterium]